MMCPPHRKSASGKSGLISPIQERPSVDFKFLSSAEEDN